MKAFLPLACLALASCSVYPGAGRSRVIFGRILSTPEVEIWLGHVTGGGQVYEVAPERDPRRLLGVLLPREPAARCPYNGRPREQLFRIEYAVGPEPVYGAADPGTRLPPHLRTNLFVLRCQLVGGPR